MIETIITVKLYTTKKTFDGKDFQDLLNKIEAGMVQRDFVKSGVLKAKMFYTTNRKKNE